MRTLFVFAGILFASLDVSADQPNIVYIMVDDMGPSDAGFMGSVSINTPNLDALATRSLVFTEAYSGCTVCAPCRSVLMTGKHMGRTSVRLNTGGVPLLDHDVTTAEVLKKVGYRTGGFGKWGLGDVGTDGVPEKQGFDLFYGYYHQIHAHNHYPEFLIRSGVKEAITGKPNTSEGYAPRLIFDEMKTFIRQSVAAGEPFYCYAPWTPPHAGYEFPQDDPIWGMYRDQSWKKSEIGHAAMVSLVDRYVGETMALLNELKILDNTIIFFHSDNGASLSPAQGPNLKSSGRYRGNKRSAYEGGVRAPTLVHWRGKIEPGLNRDFIVSAQDALPTLAELAGATKHLPCDVTGISYAPVLFGKPPSKRHEFHYWEWVQWDWSQNQAVEGGLMQGLRKDNWKIARIRNDQPWELYNLADDIGETNDLAEQEPEQLKLLVDLAEKAREPMREQEEPKHPSGQKYN